MTHLPTAEQSTKKSSPVKAVFTSLLFCVALWPVWIVVMASIDWLFGEGVYSVQLDLLPKKTVLSQLLSDQLQSLVVCIPAGLALLLELLLFRTARGSRLFAGVLTTIAITATAYWFFKPDMNPVIVVIVASLISLAIARLGSMVLWAIFRIGRKSNRTAHETTNSPSFIADTAAVQVNKS